MDVAVVGTLVTVEEVLVVLRGCGVGGSSRCPNIATKASTTAPVRSSAQAVLRCMVAVCRVSSQPLLQVGSALAGGISSGQLGPSTT